MTLFSLTDHRPKPPVAVFFDRCNLTDTNLGTMDDVTHGSKAAPTARWVWCFLALLKFPPCSSWVFVSHTIKGTFSTLNEPHSSGIYLLGVCAKVLRGTQLGPAVKSAAPQGNIFLCKKCSGNTKTKGEGKRGKERRQYAWADIPWKSGKEERKGVAVLALVKLHFFLLACAATA